MKWLQRFLAVIGTVLAWLPILAPLIFSVVGFLRRGTFHLDYLMPAEFFPVALLGGGLLFGTALWTRSRRAMIGAGLGTEVVSLAGSQGLALASGLASGAAAPEGLAWVLVLALITLYSVAVVGVGMGGILLLNDLFKPPVTSIKPAD